MIGTVFALAAGAVAAVFMRGGAHAPAPQRDEALGVTT